MPEVEAEEEPRDVVVDRENDCADEEDEEAREGQRVSKSGERMALPEGRVPEHHGRGLSEPVHVCRLSPVTCRLSPAVPVLLDEARHAPDEDRRRDGDEGVPDGNLPWGEAFEDLTRLHHVSFPSSSATSKRSATAP